MAATPRHLMIEKVNWWWYLVPILPILAVGYAALMTWLPSWALLVAIAAVGVKTSLASISKVGGRAISALVADTVFLAVFVLAAMLLLGPERIGV